MAAQSIVEDGAPTHSVRIEWFRRDPGGGTIFVKPIRDDSAAHTSVERTNPN
jgi:hypothetical protein